MQKGRIFKSNYPASFWLALTISNEEKIVLPLSLNSALSEDMAIELASVESGQKVRQNKVLMFEIGKGKGLPIMKVGIMS